MAVNYVCSACGRNWDADEYRDDLDCPECSGRLVAQDKVKGAAGAPARKPVNPTIPNSPPAFKGLKVARPVGSLGSRRSSPGAGPAAAAAEPDTGETQSVPTSALPNAEFASQVETLYAKRLEQAEEAARLLVGRAELDAERTRRDLIAQAEKDAKQRAATHLAELQADLNAQIEIIRASRKREAEQEAEAIVIKATEDAKAAAEKQIEEAIGKAREDLAIAVAENEARERKLREAAEKLKTKNTGLAALETALQERTRKAQEAEETLRTAVEKIRVRKAELDKLDAEAKEAREKIEAEKQASEERLRTAIDKLKAEKTKIEEEKQAAEKQATELREAAEKRAEELRLANEKRTQELADKEKTLREVADKLKTQRDDLAANAAHEATPPAEPAAAAPVPATELETKLDDALKSEQSAKRELEKLQQSQDKRQRIDEDSRKTAWNAANDAHHSQLLVMIAVGLLSVLAVLNAGLLLSSSKGLGLVLLVLTAIACWWTAMIYRRLRKAIEQLFTFFVKSSLANRNAATSDSASQRPTGPTAKKPGKAGAKRNGGKKSTAGSGAEPEEASAPSEEDRTEGATAPPDETKDAEAKAEEAGAPAEEVKTEADKAGQETPPAAACPEDAPGEPAKHDPPQSAAGAATDAPPEAVKPPPAP